MDGFIKVTILIQGLRPKYPSEWSKPSKETNQRIWDDFCRRFQKVKCFPTDEHGLFLWREDLSFVSGEIVPEPLWDLEKFYLLSPKGEPLWFLPEETPRVLETVRIEFRSLEEPEIDPKFNNKDLKITVIRRRV